METENILIILSLICAVIGWLGAILPALPGPPISYVGLLLLFLSKGVDVGVVELIVAGVFAVAVTLLDYIMPMWLAKITGGTNKGIVGAGIGMFVGLFFIPLGLVIGPFIGALVGELLAGTQLNKALGVSFMSFVSFMLTTGIKFIYVSVLLFMIVSKTVHFFI